MEITKNQRRFLIAYRQQTDPLQLKPYPEVATSIGLSEAETEEIVNYLTLQEVGLLEPGSHPLARLSAKGRHIAELFEETKETGMSAYNLTDRQEQILREMVTKCPKDQSPDFFYVSNSMFQGVRFHTNNESIELTPGDLRAFETERLVSLEYHDGGILGGQIKKLGFAAVSRNFQNPQPTANPMQHVVVHGDGNIVNTTAGNGNVTTVYQQVDLPDPNTVDIVAALTAIQGFLAGVGSSDQKKIDNAIGEAVDDAAKGDADKDEIGQALDRAFRVAERTGKLAKIAAQVKPYVVAAAAWLGPKWHHLLHLMGFAAS